MGKDDPIVRMKCPGCDTKWTETFPEGHAVYGVCPGYRCVAEQPSGVIIKE